MVKLEVKLKPFSYGALFLYASYFDCLSSHHTNAQPVLCSPLEHCYSCLRLKTGGNKPPLILEAFLLTSYSRTKNVMTCVTAARASHLIFRAEISKACSGRAGCSWHRISFFLCLFRAGGEHLVPGEGQHSGDAWADANRLCLQKRFCGILEGERQHFCA